jgi:hypothetical protein
MSIELRRNGEINVKKLTQQELEILVDIKLDYYKARFEEINHKSIQINNIKQGEKR